MGRWGEMNDDAVALNKESKKRKCSQINMHVRSFVLMRSGFMTCGRLFFNSMFIGGN